MKNLAILFLLLFITNLKAAYDPTSIKGRAETTPNGVTNFQVPNKLATKVAARTYLLENGNTNLLENPSFEHSTPATGWTSTTVTPSASTSTKVDGSQSLCFTASSQAFTLTQDSTLFATEFGNGYPGLATISVKTNHSAAVTFCSRSAGTTSTTNCQTVTANDQWFPYTLPVVLGGTSNGISISAASGSGTTCLDFAKLEPGKVTSDIYPGTAWTAYTPTFTGFGTVTVFDCKHRLVGQNREIDCRFTPGTATATEARVSLPSGDVASSSLPSISVAGYFAKTGTDIGILPLKEPSVSYVTFGRQNSTDSGLTKINGNNVSSGSGNPISFFASVPLQGYSGVNTNYYAACGAACREVFTAKMSSTGVVSDDVGDWINGNCAKTAAGKFDCTFNSGVFTVAPTCFAIVRSRDGRTVNLNPDTSSTHLFTTAADGGVNEDNTLNLLCIKAGVDAIASRTIVGSFKDVVTSIGSSSSTSAGADIQSVFFGTGASCTTACSSGTCTICSQTGNKITSVTWISSTIYQINGIDGTKYNCVGTGDNGTALVALLHARNSSTSTYARIGAQGADVNRASVICIGVP